MKTRSGRARENSVIQQKSKPTKKESKKKVVQEVVPKKKLKKQKAKSPSPSPPKRQSRKEKAQERVNDNSNQRKKKEPKHADQQELKRKLKDEKRRQQQQQQKRQKAKLKTSPSKQKVKQVIVKGAAPVDEHFFDQNKFHVLVHNNKVYSATLNQTNVSNNNNKFYLIQILQSDANTNTNYLFTRWGRVGHEGQSSNLGPYPLNIAISEYEKKHRQKHKKGDYRQIQLNYGNDEASDQEEDKNKQQDAGNKKDVNKLNQYMDSKLNKHVKDFVNLIFDIGMMNDQMKKIGYNINKMPLGKLSKNNIHRGNKILQQLHQQVSKQKPYRQTVQALTNDFYSYIPHDFGHAKMHLFTLDTVKKVKQKLEMLESLAQIKIATQILNRQQDGNKIDNNYKRLNRDITYIERDSFTFQLINDYLQSSHASTHRNYDLELIDLFETDCQFENKRYTQDLHNKMLLWHGSRLTNYVGILSQGLRIAPPQAPVTGYMFGKGVYFADSSSKSANYCCTSRQNNTGILILCETALGNMNQKLQSDYYAANLPPGKHSTKGVGKTAPKQQNYQTYKDAIVPMGPSAPTNIQGAILLYNQYIVYKIEQIKTKFILRTKFHYKQHF